jgi:Proteins involved in synaptic transmission and general secretion, Sec1 family
MTKRLAEKVKETIIKEEKLFDMRQGDAVPVLLIIDRTCDPITPLLSQVRFLLSFEVTRKVPERRRRRMGHRHHKIDRGGEGSSEQVLDLHGLYNQISK